VKYEDDDKALVLLHYLPRSYETFVDILKHGRDTLSLDDVIGVLNSKELQNKVKGKSSPRDALTAKFRIDKRDPMGRGRSRSRSRIRKKTIKCYYFHEESHIKKNCPKKKKDLQERSNSDGGVGGVSICEFKYDSADALVVSKKA